MAVRPPLAMCLLIGLVSSAVHQDPLSVSKIAHSKDDAYYDFRYAVDDEKSGVVADRWESRSGRFVKGAYSFLGPDGKVRSVHYEVDGDHGFKAVVRTDTPRFNLLSIQSEKQANIDHADPPINKVLVDPPPLPPGNNPYNYHAKPELVQSLQALASPAAAIVQRSSQVSFPPITTTTLTPPNTPLDIKAALFSDDLIQRQSINIENTEALQDLIPPAVDAYSRSYDSYPRPVRTNPNRRPTEPVREIHRTVYSDYINKELQRIAPLNRSPTSSRGLGLQSVRLLPPPSASVPSSVSGSGPAKRNSQYLRQGDPILTASHEPAPFSRQQWSRPSQYLTGRSSLSSSYFL